jgi:septum formation protein
MAAKAEKAGQARSARQGIVLASASPRRELLLSAAGIKFKIMPAEIDESPMEGENPGQRALRLGKAKAEAVLARVPSEIVIAADTIVELDGVIYGKPKNLTEAGATLKALSGKAHTVITGFSVRNGLKNTERSGLETTTVTFRHLSKFEIENYLAKGESLGKAGAYAIQLGAGFMTARIEGSYTNIMGLPLEEVLNSLSAVK